MTLSQAARTGRKFRRKAAPEIWYWLAHGSFWKSVGGGPETSYGFTTDEIIANDYEVDPLALMLTAQDIERAAREHDKLASQRRLSASEFAKLICESLGLIEEEL